MERHSLFHEALNEALELVMHHTHMSCEAEGTAKVGLHLKMASRAMRCALEIYGDYLSEIVKGEKREKV
jgi:hypothetical protein